METYAKISEAIAMIKKKDLKKQGRNKFSGYDYYTPAQVSELTTWACHEVKLLPKFDLIRSKKGIVGRLSIYDLEAKYLTGPVVYEMAGAIPDIKATNVAQQLGGAMTYAKRYLLMNAFDITDNNLDFDTTENTKKVVESSIIDEVTEESIKNALYVCSREEEIKQIWDQNPELHKDKKFVKLVVDAKKAIKVKS